VQLRRVQLGSRCAAYQSQGGQAVEFEPEEKHFVSGNSLFFLFWGRIKSSYGGLWGVLMSPKRRVRARAAKIH
jgi:hypothetical protein